MKVRELIDELQKHDQDSDVILSVYGYVAVAHEVEYIAPCLGKLTAEVQINSGD